MGALHVEFVLTSLNNTDRVEADGLLDGIGDRLAMNLGGDSEVFKLVVHEVYGIVVGCLIQVAKHI